MSAVVLVFWSIRVLTEWEKRGKNREKNILVTGPDGAEDRDFPPFFSFLSDDLAIVNWRCFWWEDFLVVVKTARQKQKRDGTF